MLDQIIQRLSYYSLSPAGSYCSFLLFNWSFLFWVFWHYVCCVFKTEACVLENCQKLVCWSPVSIWNIMVSQRIVSNTLSVVGVFHKPLKPDCNRSLSQVSIRSSVKTQSAIGAILRNTACVLRVPNFRFFYWNVKTDTWNIAIFVLSQFSKDFKMISAQHSSNNGKNWRKLSYQKILLAW